MATDQSNALAQQFQDTLLRLEKEGEHALSSMVDLFADQARLSNAALRRRGHEHHGKAEIEEFWRRYLELLGSGRTTFHHTTTSEHAAGLFWRTALPEGGEAYDGVTLLDFDPQGKVSSMEGYYDPDAVKQEITKSSTGGAQ